MPRQARIDYPGLLHHVVVRGIERRAIFMDKADYEEFLERLEHAKQDARIFAWALMPNHVHLLVRTGLQPLARFMRRLLTGYAVYFNGRHRRAGHLFQNRYKSIVCEEDAYLKVLARYIHLNPLKAGLVKGLAGLSAYPWCGHGVVIGKRKAAWQDVDGLLGHFAEHRSGALREYLRYLLAGIGEKENVDLLGGGLIRSAGGFSALAGRRRAKEYERGDARILGDGEFVNRVLRETERGDQRARKTGSMKWEQVKSKICRHFGVKDEDLAKPVRNQSLARAREALVYVALSRLGMTGESLGEAFKKTNSGISRAFYRASGWVKGDEEWLTSLN
jgi:REP element-mobilizing transposase RayT